jgi:ketosteroid isomerase-like protein
VRRISEDNVEIVRRFYKCWTDQDFDGVLACADPAVCFDWSESRSPYRGVYTGHEGVMEFRKELEEAFDDFSVEAIDTIELDSERLVTVTAVRGRGRESGILLRADGAMLWRLREGRILGGKLFQNKDEALEAAGPLGVGELRRRRSEPGG